MCAYEFGRCSQFEAQKGNLFNASTRRVDSIGNNGEEPRHLPLINTA